MGMANKILKAAKSGTLVAKVAPYLWYCCGLSLLVRLWCRMTRAKPGLIIFNNFHGRGFGDHQKYIALELLRRKAPVEMAWLARNPAAVAKTLPSGVRIVRISRFLPFAAIREMARAQFWCSNQSFTEFVAWGLAKKRGQIYVNTHHGSLGIKRIGSDIPHARTIPLRERVLRRDASMIDILVANAVWEADFVYSRRFYGMGEVKLWGHPRNDILFSDGRELAARVRRILGCEASDRLLFYAPTYREKTGTSFYLTSFREALDACARRFGGTWRAVVRLHPIMRRADFRFGADVVDATDYPDIQELMVAADAMVCDYSSCMFDFMLTRRPVFVYAPDMEEYERTQGFYYPMSETPFPVAKSEEELSDRIRAFDDAKYRAGVEGFLKGKGCVEDGHATERVANLIQGRMG